MSKIHKSTAEALNKIAATGSDADLIKGINSKTQGPYTWVCLKDDKT